MLFVQKWKNIQNNWRGYNTLSVCLGQWFGVGSPYYNLYDIDTAHVNLSTILPKTVDIQYYYRPCSEAQLEDWVTGE